MNDGRTATIEVSPEDPLHQASRPEMSWTVVNTSEALPGILTPLTWTFWRDSMNVACRRAYYLLGAFPRRELRPSPDPLENFGAAFLGRYTASLELRARVADVMPGTSRKEDAEHLLGQGLSPAESRRTSRRYPIIFVRAPWVAFRISRRLSRVAARNEARWQTAVRTHTTWTAPRAVEEYLGAREGFRAAMAEQAMVTFLGGYLMARTAKIAHRAGMPDAAQSLIAGGRSLDELGLMQDLDAVAGGTLSQVEFLSRHGYHGVNEGHLTGIPWRVDPRPISVRLSALRRRSDDDPRAQRARQRQAVQTKSAAVLTRLPARARPWARLTIFAARHILPLREVGKRAFLQTVDVARMAAKMRADQLVADGVLAEPGDVHYMTERELINPVPRADLAEVIAFRKQRRALYESIDMPQSWVGDPVPIYLADTTETDTAADQPPAQLQGTGVGSGVVTGIARVVLDPAVDDLEPDEVLVCSTTDPSWIPLMQLASALVTDVGSSLSHAAIIARELGLPCVVNVGTATRQISTGDRVRVNAAAGTVEVLSPLDAPAT